MMTIIQRLPSAPSQERPPRALMRLGLICKPALLAAMVSANPFFFPQPVSIHLINHPPTVTEAKHHRSQNEHVHETLELE